MRMTKADVQVLDAVSAAAATPPQRGPSSVAVLQAQAARRHGGGLLFAIFVVWPSWPQLWPRMTRISTTTGPASSRRRPSTGSAPMALGGISTAASSMGRGSRCMSACSRPCSGPRSGRSAGLLSGFFGGRIDQFIQRCADVMFTHSRPGAGHGHCHHARPLDDQCHHCHCHPTSPEHQSGHPLGCALCQREPLCRGVACSLAARPGASCCATSCPM